MRSLRDIILRHAGLVAGGVLLGMVILAAAFGPVLSVYDPEDMAMDAMMAPPDAAHLAGTDNLGRDVLVRTLLGARSTLLLAGLATLLGVATGSLVGMIAGFRGGLTDEIMMRAGDTVMALPSLVLAMLILVSVGSGPTSVVAAIAVIFVPRVARIVRSSVLNVRTLDFVSAARVIGESEASVLFREVLPNIWPFILVEGCLRVSYAILLISALGYLGIGVQPPTPDWGLMISESSAYITAAPWMIIAPAAGIVCSVVGINLLGDGVQELVGARTRRMASHV